MLFQDSTIDGIQDLEYYRTLHFNPSILNPHQVYVSHSLVIEGEFNTGRSVAHVSAVHMASWACARAKS